MSEPSVARRYAQALSLQADADGVTGRVDQDVALIRETMTGSRDLVRLFESPVIPRKKKEAVIQRLLGPRVHPLVLQFLSLLIAKKREGLFPAIARAYIHLRNWQQGVVEAQVRVPQPLSGPSETRLRLALEQMTGAHVRLLSELDPELIGGVMVRLGDTVYDGSVRRQLQVLQARLERGGFSVDGRL
jgi:F-type H+-transporting ATPase subunit delta